jgi:hypothetical protein
MPAWAFGETLVVISVVGGSTFGLTERARVSGVGADESDNSNVNLKAQSALGSQIMLLPQCSISRQAAELPIQGSIDYVHGPHWRSTS